MEIIIEFTQAINNIVKSSALMSLGWQNYIMIGISCVLMYLAIVKKFEPLLLLPIAFGMFLSNLMPAIMSEPQMHYQLVNDYIASHGGETANYTQVILDGRTYYQIPQVNGGLLYYLYQGVKLGIYPPIIFLGIGTMTDFGPLIANPGSFLLGAAAQLGIFLSL